MYVPVLTGESSFQGLLDIYFRRVGAEFWKNIKFLYKNGFDARNEDLKNLYKTVWIDSVLRWNTRCGTSF